MEYFKKMLGGRGFIFFSECNKQVNERSNKQLRKHSFKLNVK